MWDPYAEFEKTVLPNGLAVYASQWPGRSWQHMSFMIHAGAKEDPVGLEGLAHFVEHLMSVNAPRPSAEITHFFEDWGGKAYLGGTNFKSTHYTFSIPAQRAVLTEALDLYGQMLLCSPLSKEVERERQVILGEFRRVRPHQFLYECEMRRQRALHPKDSWLSRFDRPLGAPPSIEAISTDDLQTFYNRYYAPKNISIVSVGGMQNEEVLQLLAGSPFGKSKEGERVSLPKPESAIWFPAETRYEFRFSDIFEAKSKIDAGKYQTTAVVPGAFNERALELFSDMLDIILTEEVREKRAWCYHIESSFTNFLTCYQFDITCNGLATEAFDVIEKVIEQCVFSVAHRPDLFEKKKKQALAKRAMKDYTGKVVCHSAAGDALYFDRIIPMDEEDEKLRSVRFDDVKRFVPYLAASKCWTLLMRP